MVRAMLLAGLHLVRSFEIVDRHGRPAVSLGKIKLDETWFDLFDDE